MKSERSRAMKYVLLALCHGKEIDRWEYDSLAEAQANWDVMREKYAHVPPLKIRLRQA